MRSGGRGAQLIKRPNAPFYEKIKLLDHKIAILSGSID